MSLEFIALIIFVLSLCGAIYILVRKIPALNTLPQTGASGIRGHHFILGVEEKIKQLLAAFEKQIFLHKFLSWVKVMTLRIETRVDNLLHRIRQKNKPN